MSDSGCILGRSRLLSVLLTISVGATACATHVAKTAGEPLEPGIAATATSAPPRPQGSSGGSDAAATTSWWSSIPLLSSLLDFNADSWSNVAQPGVWSGDLDFSFDTQSQSLRSPDGAEVKTTGKASSAGMSIRNNGFSLIDPRLLRGNVGLRFSRQQSRGGGASESEQQGLLTDYSLYLVALEEKPYNASISASRTQGTTTLFSGGTSQLITENRSATLRLREDSLLRDEGILPWFSANLRVAQERSQEDTQVADSRFRRDDQRTLFSLDGHNGFETADLDFRYERSDFVNHMNPSGSYQSQLANVSYSLDFGPTRNRRWDSRVVYASRDGSRVTSSLSVDESLSVEHFANLSSAYNYQFIRQETPEGIVTSQSGGMKVQHQLYRNLSTTLGVTGSHLLFASGSRDSAGAQLSFSYSHRLPGNGQLTAALGGSVAITSNQMAAGVQAVFDAPYQAPPLLGAGAGFVLNDRFIVAETIVVLAIKGGARVLTTPGIDYLVVDEGDQTRILPQSTSAIIQPGDRLEVSYQFRLDPNIRYRSSSRSMSLGIDYGWIGASFSHDQSAEQSLGGGESNFLGNSIRDSLRLNVREEWEQLSARADASVTRTSDGNIDLRRFELSQSVLYQPNLSWTFGLNASWHRVNYVSPPRESVGKSISLNVDWLAPGGWIATANLSRRQLRDTKVPSETIDQLSVRLNRKWAKLAVNMTLSLSDRERSGSNASNVSVHFNAIRQF